MVDNSGKVIWKINKKKKKLKIRERVGNMWMMGPLMWFNKSVATINVTIQLIDIVVDPCNA